MNKGIQSNGYGDGQLTHTQISDTRSGSGKKDVNYHKVEVE